MPKTGPQGGETIPIKTIEQARKIFKQTFGRRKRDEVLFRRSQNGTHLGDFELVLDDDGDLGENGVYYSLWDTVQGCKLEDRDSPPMKNWNAVARKMSNSIGSGERNAVNYNTRSTVHSGDL